MLLPRSHTWTATQKRLIVSGAILSIAALVAIIFSYEHYYRGPGREILCGTWYGPNFFTEDPAYLQLDDDGTFTFGSAETAQLYPVWRGRWYAGGTKIYLSVIEGSGTGRPVILHIVDIQPTELRLRFFSDGDALVYRRAGSTSAHASNHAIQRTASKPPIYALSICHSSFPCERSHRRLAVADLILVRS